MSHEPAYLTKGPDAALIRLMKGLTHDVTNRRLIILLVALVAVFGLLIGERFFSKATVQSMAFQ